MSLYNKKYFLASRRFQQNPQRIKILVTEILKYNPHTVLDVGCGLGVVVKALHERGITAAGIDSAEDLKEFWGDKLYFKLADAKDLPCRDKAYDLVFSSDFFEHIEEKDIDQVANEMKRVGKQVLVFVADDQGTILAGRQKAYHVTHKPLSWWKDKLKGIDTRSSHL